MLFYSGKFDKLLQAITVRSSSREHITFNACIATTPYFIIYDIRIGNFFAYNEINSSNCQLHYLPYTEI